MSENNLPTVTVAIPAFNEEENIRNVIEVFSKSSYPKIVQILVADGRSTDKTADIVHELSSEDKRVELVDNPDRLQAAGLNRLISIAEGDLFLRADAHCEYASDYVEEAVEAYIASGALNVGGHQRFVAKNNLR